MFAEFVLPEFLWADIASFSWSDLARLPIVLFLVLLNAFFVAGEFAVVAIRRTEVEQLLKTGTPSARSLHRQVEILDDTIGACQLGITVASLLLGWIGESALAQLIFPLFSFLGLGWQVAATHTVASFLAIVLITIMHVVLGEQTPKLIALQRPEKVALWVALPLEYFTWITKPFVLAMNGMSNGITRLLGLGPSNGEHRLHSVEELTMLVEEVEEAGLLSAEQAEYVTNVFRLSAKKVGECMLPRERMVCLELHTPLPQVLEQVRESAHTRIPVYDGTLDNIVGIVNTKDLLHLVSLQGMAILDDAIYPATFLTPDQSIALALRQFKKAHKHMAIVRNHKNEVLGLITLEDILEEIIGDIEDEHDQPLTRHRYRLGQATRRMIRPPAPAASPASTGGSPPPAPPPPAPWPPAKSQEAVPPAS
ncbi:MAG TPA: hemolysin family protein [Gemmatales bacterium]|nr:hemolysin family protein [Gemmatales bacterium]